MTFDQMLERVRHEGAHPTRERAEEAVRNALAALGRQITGDERVAFAQRLPAEAAPAMTAQVPDYQASPGPPPDPTPAAAAAMGPDCSHERIQATFEPDCLTAEHAKIYVRQRRHSPATWLWFLS
ncbi:DUF2267 domain-containing protein [Streptomyces sp. NPDC097617]|uniref:DUF2267 domain-containing protein n=1 Tax=Streptomyces sp. NPDC097617 TaxID=3366091 RepID=UPI003814654E